MNVSSLLFSGSSHKKIKTMKKIFIVTAMMIGSQLSAQDTTELENLILTANKYSTKTTETGKVVVVITREQIQKAGSRDLSQLITELGGVFINGYTNNPGKEKNIYLRGAKVDHTLITIDGIPVYDASGIGSNFDIRYFPIDNVEKVEILKGSQGTLYGSDAIAGVINIITKKASTNQSLSGAAHYGSFNTKRAGLNYSSKHGKLSYSIGANHLSSDGFSEARKPEGSSAEFDKDGFSQNNLMANFGIELSQQLNIQPFIRYSANRGDLDQDAFTDEKDFDYTAKNLQAGIRNLLRINKTQLNLLYQFNHTKRNYLDDSTVSVNGYYKYSESEYTAREHFAEFFAVVPFNNFKLTTGVDLRRSATDYSAKQKTIFSNNLENASFSGDSIKQNQQSLYASLQFQKNGFTMEAGGRLNNHSAYGNNFAFNVNPSFLLNQKLKLFANFSSGYKVPSLYQLYSFYGNKDLEPEVSTNVEAGLQYFLADKRSAIRAGVFKRNVEDVIAFFYDPATFQSKYINQDKQDDKGFELDAKIYAGKFSISALYSYVDGEITTKQNGKDTSYFNLLRRPKSTLNFSLGAQLTPKIYVSTQFNVVGKSRDIYFDPNTFQAVDIHLDNYFLLNFYAAYSLMNDKLKIFADIRNITDKTYTDVYGYNTAGFNAYGGIRFSL
jgi:vitamin B12 transporter